MIVDFSILTDRLGEQLTLLLIMLQRAAVQRQLLVMAAILLLAWAGAKLYDRMLEWLEVSTQPSPAEPRDQTEGEAQEVEPGEQPLPPAPKPGATDLRRRLLRLGQIADFLVFPALLLLLSYRAVTWLEMSGWPGGLIAALTPFFWLLLAYRLLVRLVLAALPQERSKRFAAELLRPIVWILILLIARNILFSTLGLGDIGLLRLAEWTLTVGGLLDALIVVLLAFIFGGAVRKVLINVLVRGEVEPDVADTVSGVARYAVIGFGGLIALGFLGIDISALAWISGALVVGLSFGLQELIANFVSGIVLISERIVRPGDVIEVNGTQGIVSKVFMRATVLQTYDKTDFVIPNKELMTKPVLALTYSDRMMRVLLNIRVAYDSDLALVEQVLLDVIRRHPLILPDPPPVVRATALEPDSIQLMAWGFVAEFSNWFRVRSELFEQVRDALTAHGIVMPYPRQDVRVHLGNPDAWDGLRQSR